MVCTSSKVESVNNLTTLYSPNAAKLFTGSTLLEAHTIRCGVVNWRSPNVAKLFTDSTLLEAHTYYKMRQSQHIWSFAGGDYYTYPQFTCPCVTGNTASNLIPSFVSQN